MEIKNIEKEFKEKVCKEIRLMEEGVNRYHIFTPFQFDDGDSFAIVLKRTGNKWILSDEGHTFMHMSYDLDMDSLDTGNRAKIIGTTLNTFGVKENKGILIAEVNEKNIGNMFYNYVQALIKITDITYLNSDLTK